jgi:hypothetical protein
MKLPTLASILALALAGCERAPAAPSQPTPPPTYTPGTTLRINEWNMILAVPVPAGCLYSQYKVGMAFSPYACLELPK